MFWTGETLHDQIKAGERVDASFHYLNEQLVRFQIEKARIDQQVGLTSAFASFLDKAEDSLPPVIPLNSIYPYEFTSFKYKNFSPDQRIKHGVYRYFFPRTITVKGGIIYTIAPMLTPDGIPLYHFPESEEFVDINFRLHFLKSPDMVDSEYQYSYDQQIATIKIKGGKKSDTYNGLIITTLDDRSGWGIDYFDIQKILDTTNNPCVVDQKKEIRDKINCYKQEIKKIANWRASDMLRRLQNIVRFLGNVSLSKPLPEVIGYLDEETNSMFYYAPADEKVVDSRQKSAKDIKDPQDVDSIVNWVATAENADPLTIIHTAVPFAAALQEHYRKFYRPTIQFHNPFRK